MASRTITPPEATTQRTGCRPSEPPIAANRAPVGSSRHAFDGQKTRVPSRETIAGTRVSPASRVTATAIASAGPSA
jgi:hypothetical protein